MKAQPSSTLDKLVRDLIYAANEWEQRALKAEAEAAQLRGLVERAHHVIPLTHEAWHTEARAALMGGK